MRIDAENLDKISETEQFREAQMNANETSSPLNNIQNDTVSIAESISEDYINNFQPVHKRYFEAKYCTQFSTNELNLDTCIRVHSNKICVVYLADKHSMFQKHETIKKLNFQVSNKTNRLNNAISGKGKRGAQFLAPNSILCFIETESGVSYPVHAGINGKLLEINSEIVDRPSLIVEDNLSDGFVAVMLCDLKRFQENMALLKTSDQYFDSEEQMNIRSRE